MSGDVVVVPFPFSDLTEFKKRPALILAALQGEDLILCQITTKRFQDPYVVQLGEYDFQSGKLKVESNIRPNRLFTVDQRIILYKIGKIKQSKLEEVKQKIVEIFDL